MSTTYKMSGGPLDSDALAAMSNLRKQIIAEPDVAALLALELLADGSYLYLIATPYLYPSHVIGVTDAENTEPAWLFQCGAEWSAREQWNRLLETTSDETA